MGFEEAGNEYFHEKCRKRNRIERRFRKLKDRTKRFHNNINSKTVKSIDKIVAVIVLIHNQLHNKQNKKRRRNT